MNAINFLSVLMSSYDDYTSTIDRSRKILQNAGMYSDANFEMLKQRAIDESVKTDATFFEIMPRVVAEYINNMQ